MNKNLKKLVFVGCVSTKIVTTNDEITTVFITALRSHEVDTDLIIVEKAKYFIQNSEKYNYNFTVSNFCTQYDDIIQRKQ